MATEPLTADDLKAHIRAIPAAVDESKRRKIENWPVRANRASELGHPCTRYLTYLRTHWQERALHSVALQYLFDERRRQEDHAVEDLREAGYYFAEQQRPFAWEKYQITGRIDGQIGLPRGAERPTLVPAEIKNINQWDWERVDPEGGARQFLDSEKIWLRKIPGQMAAYLLMNNKDLGALILRNASDGRPKVVEVAIDWEVGEEILRKAELVNAHAAAGTLPDRIPFEEAICGRCPFFHICLPDEAFRAGASLLDDPDLEARLARRAELEVAAREYERIDKEIKAVAKRAIDGDGEALVGTDWLLRVKTIDRKAYAVEPGSYQKVEIHKLGAGEAQT